MISPMAMISLRDDIRTACGVREKISVTHTKCEYRFLQSKKYYLRIAQI